jgi:uncharacterized damage-inducible protein DinB
MSDLAVTYLRAMAHNNRWANHRLLTACAGLSQAELEARRTSFFPSLSATLNHILIIDWFYVDALEGGSLGPAAFADDMPCPALPTLAAEQAAVDARLIAFCEALTPERLGAETRVSRGEGRWQIERTDRLLLHLFQHDIHHRGQAHAMLSGTSVPPPQLDEFFSAMDSELRAPDLAALGWTEADIWPQPG